MLSSSRYCCGWSSPWGPGSVNMRLILVVWRRPYLLIMKTWSGGLGQIPGSDTHPQAELHALQLLSHIGQVPLLAFPSCPSWRACIHPSQHSSHVTAQRLSSSFYLFPMLPALVQRCLQSRLSMLSPQSRLERFPHKTIPCCCYCLLNKMYHKVYRDVL